MIDFHTHVLPGIDDGSRDIAMTERMLEMEMEQGVTKIFATPHFYANRKSVYEFLARRSEANNKVLGLLDKRPELPEIRLGAEVYFFSGIGKAKQLSELCIEGTDILLLEMPFAQWTEDMLRDVRDIRSKRHLRIILAHAERYEQLQKHKNVWNEILSMPLTIQMNAGSFVTGLTSGLSARHTAKFCMNLIQVNDRCIIGTDCHNLTDRAPNQEAARKTIEKKAGRERLRLLDEYTETLLGKV